MFAYWFMYLIPSLATILSIDRRKRELFPFLAIGTLFALFIGLRYRVGGDWFNYYRQFESVSQQTLIEVATSSDPGYALLNWLMYRWGLDIYGVNMVCGIIFLTGLIVFCRQQSKPWLGFTVSVPYLVFVLSMGYTRQSVALGFFFLAIASLERGIFNRYIVFVAAAALFHKTSIILIALGLFLHRKNWKLRVLAILLAGYGLWDLLLAQSQDLLWQVYVEAQMVSEGAKIRVMMNVVPALFMLYYRKKWKELYSNYWFWIILSLCSVTSVGLVGFASTAVDRIALYFTPLQVVVLSRLPMLVHKQSSPKVLAVCIILGYAVVLFVWMNYATHARYWLPYQNWLFF